ncbi:MAG TPA: hypothetical protein VK631_10200 [Solirubrobacteraceae bacterium]|nr:hypothetical protein [Solirubrobacteraceae bacterium]
MEEAVRAELDHLLGYMRACQRTVADIDSGDISGPDVPDSAAYVRAMTWAQAAGALQMLEDLRLISHEEREAWEHEARTLVERPPRR